MNYKDYIDIPMRENDAGAKTVGEYFEKLLWALWVEEDGFSGKRPFGNSSWKDELYLALISAEVVRGVIDEDGYLEDFDDITADHICREIIKAIFMKEE